MTPLEIIVSATMFGIAVIGCLYLLHQFQVHRWRTKQRKLYSLPDFELSESEREQEREFTGGLIKIGAWILLPLMYVVLLILNIQRAPPLTDWTWAPLAAPLAAGLGYLLFLNVTTGGGLAGIKTPAAWHVLLRTGLVSFLVILLFIIFRHAISHVYNVWPSVERSAEQTGIRQLFGEWWDDPWIFFAVPLAIFLFIYGISRRFTLPEWLWPDKTPVFTDQHRAANSASTVSAPPAAGMSAVGKAALFVFFVAFIFFLLWTSGAFPNLHWPSGWWSDHALLAPAPQQQPWYNPPPRYHNRAPQPIPTTAPPEPTEGGSYPPPYTPPAATYAPQRPMKCLEGKLPVRDSGARIIGWKPYTACFPL